MSSTLRAVLEAESARRTSEWVLRMPGSIRTTFETLFAELGLSHCTPHTLRHTLISHLLMRGTPIFTVSKLIAVSVAQIERTYGHLTAAHLRAALEPG
jgi:site-specific recombinase XerD